MHMTQVWEQPHEGLPRYHATLDLQTTLKISQILEGGHSPQTLSFLHLRGYAHLLEEAGLSGHKYTLHWASLLARWLWLLGMVVLAASFASRPIRQGGAFKLIASGVSIAFVLYFLKDITYALGSSQSLPTLLAVSIPVALSFMVGIWALLHSEQG